MSDLCQQCGKAPATENWGGTHDQTSLARNWSRLVQRWCKRCVLVAQIAYQRPIVEQFAALERELAEMDQIETGNQASDAIASGSVPSEAQK